MSAVPTTLTNLNNLPVGAILLWEGDVQHLPPGWYICNGDNGTVDLTNRIPMGVGVGGAVLSGPQPGSTGPATGDGVGGLAKANAWTPGNAEAFTIGDNHAHTLPVAKVFFIQRVHN